MDQDTPDQHNLDAGQALAVTSADGPVAQHAERIRAAYSESCRHVVLTGMALTAAKAELGPGEFVRMCEENLPFSRDVAERFMRIAHHPVAEDLGRKALPSDYSSLAEIARLSPDAYETAHEAGYFTDGMTYRDTRRVVRQLLPGLALRPSRTDQSGGVTTSRGAAPNSQPDTGCPKSRDVAVKRTLDVRSVHNAQGAETDESAVIDVEPIPAPPPTPAVARPYDPPYDPDEVQEADEEAARAAEERFRRCFDEVHHRPVEVVACIVAGVFGIAPGDLWREHEFHGAARRHVVDARSVCLYVLSTQFGLSYAKAVAPFGLDPSTLHSVCRRIEDWRDLDKWSDVLDLIAEAAAAIVGMGSGAPMSAPHDIEDMASA